MAALTYVGNGAWGTGKGEPLSQPEFDGNIWELASRVAAILADLPSPIEISNIYAVGTQMHIVKEDATEYVITIPQAQFRPSRAGALDAPTDGVYAVTDGDFNRYWRYAGSSDLTIELPATATADMEVSFRVTGSGELLFPSSTDVTVNGYEGFLNQTAGPGSVVTCKFVADGVWDLIGRLAEDVTA
ncbi:hypothetical protein [Mesorhizobium ciceri]|uniref:hypothetical protein n=1 Tax=Mesorhizobium TaxID=68287 RepID=UPI000478A69E|nr:hypothetical protein [Mesorhizobium ciceri]